MSALNRSVPSPTSSSDDEFPGYRPLSNLAVAGFIFGLASILILSSVKFAFIPLLGLVFSTLALRRIAVLENAMTGRRFALAGLTLSLLFGLAAPTRAAIFHWQTRSESRRVAQQWFEALKERQPYLAQQLEKAAAHRSTPDAIAKSLSEPLARMNLKRFLDRPAVQALLTLGDRAQVRYFQQLTLIDSVGLHGVSDVYAITVEQPGEPTTFFIDLRMERTKNDIDDTWGWHVHSAEFRTTPPPAFSPAGA